MYGCVTGIKLPSHAASCLEVSGPGPDLKNDVCPTDDDEDEGDDDYDYLNFGLLRQLQPALRIAKVTATTDTCTRRTISSALGSAIVLWFGAWYFPASVK